MLDYESREQMEKVWTKVKKAGYEINMELEQQFWGTIYGRFIDADGLGWQLNHNLPQ